MPDNLGMAFDFRGTGRERIAYLRMRDPIPSHISCIVGDIVHNVRSALDHLACLIVEESGGSVTRSTQFPIFNREEEFASSLRRYLNGARPEMIEFAKGLQPFRRPDPENDNLAVIHSLDITDKHRQLLVAAVIPASVHFEAKGRRDAIEDIQIPKSMAFPLKDGAELVRIKLADGAELADFESFVKLGADLALTEPNAVRGRPIVPLMYELIEFVEQKVLFAAEQVASR